MNNLRKKLIAGLVFSLLCAVLFAHGGMFSGEKKLRVVKTQWFDIIYPERCEASAAILYAKADGVYEEVTVQYGLTPAFRMPVIITPAVEQFNAFWTAVPYNHIAIYDTGASGSSDLAVFSETLLSTFRHELTHAVTYNMKNGFWRAMGKVLGDEFAPGMFTVTTGMAEGATVTSESAAGEGRLNDEYAKHYVKQAKIEGEFPSYHDVSGASDVSPSGSPYYFNGAFHGWLQEKYGLQAYADFWYRVVNGKSLTIAGAFKKSFGIKLSAAWKQFMADYEVPQIEANPVRAGLAQDFFEPARADYSRLNNAGSLYGSLSVAGAKLIWTDRFGGRVFLREADFHGANDAPSHTPLPALFSLRGLTTARLSSDGRFIAASYMSESSPTVSARVKIYDLKNHSFYTVKESGLKNAAILAAKDEASNHHTYYLIAQKYFSQVYSIAVYKISLNKEGLIKGTEPFAELRLGTETNPYAFTPLQDGTFAWLKKERMSYSLCISALDGTLLKSFDFPEGMVVRSLSACNGAAAAEMSADSETSVTVFYFSYAQKGTLPRLGRLVLGSGGVKLSLSSEDISGGVFEPVFWNGKLVYIGEFYRQNRLLCLAGGDLGDAGSLTRGISQDDFDGASGELTPPLPSLSSTPYNPFSYLNRGILLPLSMYKPDHIGPNAADSSEFYSYLPGVTYITAQPWTSGTTDFYTLTSGWDFETETAGVSLKISTGTETPLFQTQTEIKSEFNSQGWKQGGGIFTFSSTMATGNKSKLTLSNTTKALIGSQNIYHYYIEDIVSLTWSNIMKAGPGRFENKGAAFSISYGGRRDAPFEADSDPYADLSALSAAVRLAIPRLLPFESAYGFTYNIPLNLGFKILPTSSIYGYASFGKEYSNGSGRNAKDHLGRVVFDASLDLLAFSMDVQKAIPGITAVYLNDFYISAGYAATGTAGSATFGGFQTAKLGEYFKAVVDGRGYYLDSLYIKSAVELTPNIGILASMNYKITLYSVFSVTIHSLTALEPLERLRLSFGFTMN